MRVRYQPSTACECMNLTGLQNGKYRTQAGSTVEISGEHSGISRVEFDWFEEDNACSECEVQLYPEFLRNGVYVLTWTCSLCGGGSAVLIPEKQKGERGT